MEEFIDGFTIFTGNCIEEVQETKCKQPFYAERSEGEKKKMKKKKKRRFVKKVEGWKKHVLFRLNEEKKINDRMKRIKIGDKIKIYWERERKFFAGKVKKISGNFFHIHYDDGDRKKEDLSKVIFKMCEEQSRCE